MTLTSLQRLGFLDQNELIRLVAAVEMRTPEQQQAFYRWRDDCGTKDGLVKLLHAQPVESTR